VRPGPLRGLAFEGDAGKESGQLPKAVRAMLVAPALITAGMLLRLKPRHR
jgi:hypothetical protein